MRTIEIHGENALRRVRHRRDASRAVIFQGDQVVLTHLRPGDVYMLPGGGVEEGETPEQACIREAAEETGLAVKPLKHYLTIHEFYEDWEYVSHFFICVPEGKAAQRLTEAEKAAGLSVCAVKFGDALTLFSAYTAIADVNEEKRGIYEREYKALSALFERYPEAAIGSLKRLTHPPQWKIEPLPREKWALCTLPFSYDTDGYYDVKVTRLKNGFQFRLTRKETGLIFNSCADESDNLNKLYQPWWEKAQAWGVVRDGKLQAAIETCPEEWSNRLQVTELWVSQALRGEGLGQALMNVAKDQCRREKRRALILETQTSNVRAIGFYLHEGFTPIGLDTCCYSNRDIQRGEVRLNMGWFPEE